MPHIAEKPRYAGIKRNVYKQAGATLFPNNINLVLKRNIKSRMGIRL